MIVHDKERLKQLVWAMTDYYEGDAARIQHFAKVYAMAEWIAESERLDEDTRYRISVLALTHDIGIKEAIKRYGRCNAQLQESLGPSVAKEMLDQLGFDCALIERVCTVIGRHHTYIDIDGIDCQILIEADILANLQEGTQISAVPEFYSHVFHTESGKRLLKKMYPIY